MGRKQKERKKKKKDKQLLTTTTATATATTTALSSDSVGSGVDFGVGVGRVGVGVGVAVGGTTTATETMKIISSTPTTRCYHGSTAENFAVNSEFNKVLDDWMSILMNMTTTAEFVIQISKFSAKHMKLINDPEIIKHMFALATVMFLNNYSRSSWDQVSDEVRIILLFGIKIKYPPVKDREKQEKYNRDIQTDRGIIKFLSRELLSCHCMDNLKLEAKTMEKVGLCMGCSQEFPKQILKRCSRCLSEQYCGKECMRICWPTHKQFCSPHNKSKNNGDR